MDGTPGATYSWDSKVANVGAGRQTILVVTAPTEMTTRIQFIRPFKALAEAYIRLEEEFVYLAVILDRFSRRVIGWALDRTIEDDLTLAALRMALEQRKPGPNLVHHSDRGSQYASNDYKDLLKERGIKISMSRKGNPWDNAACESFMKTLKYEEVLRNEYRDLAEARRSIQRFLEKIYNEKRLHSALNYRPPAEFERSLPSSTIPQLIEKSEGPRNAFSQA